jgi:T5SS/PEP-CTERM-associated repeat protein/probable HAF family extracellular repeat protein
MKYILMLFVVIISPDFLQAQVVFKSVGHLPGTHFSRLYQISDDGKYAVGRSGDEAFLWSVDSDTIIGLGGWPGFSVTSRALGVSADGSVVAGWVDAGTEGIKAFRWTEEGGMVDIGNLNPPSPIFEYETNARGVSSDGSVIVGWGHNEDGDREAFRWSHSGGISGLGFLSNEWKYSQAFAVSGDGEIIVGESENDDEVIVAVRWIGTGTMTALGHLPGAEYTGANGISNDGSTIVGSSDNIAVVWQGSATPTPLDLLPGFDRSSARAVSGDGSVIVGRQRNQSTGNYEAVIWDSTGPRILKEMLENDYGLDLSDWVLDHAYSISADGKVIGGRGIGPDGEEGWVVNLEPAIAWRNPLGGIFSDSSNWVGNNPPNDEQVALFDTSYFESVTTNKIINTAQPVTVTFNDLTTTKGINVSSGQIIFNVQEHSYGVENLIISGPVNTPDEAQLEIINGAIGITNTFRIGAGGYRGQMIVGDGGIMEFNPQTTDETLQIGIGNCISGDCGRLIIRDGGTVFTNHNFLGSSTIGGDGSRGSVFISGNNSEWADSTLVILGEDGGSGIIEITDGADFIGNSLWLAFLDDSKGEVIVNDEGSLIYLFDRMYVGLGSNTEAHLTISEGASGILEKGIVIGSGSGNNDVTVTGFSPSGNPSALAISDTTIIGTYGSGGMNVLNWADLVTGTTVIPGRQGGIGSALVDGEGSEWRNFGTIRLGFEGIGFIRVTNRGVLYTAKLQTGPLGSITGSNIYIGTLPPNSIENNIQKHENSQLAENVSIYVDTLLLSEGAELIADSVIFGEGGYLGGNGIFSFDVINSGGINPGDTLYEPGTLTVDADYIQMPNATLFIELGGALPGSGHDQLVVTGTAHLAGILDVRVLKDYEPEVGQSFEILTAQNITGTFDEIFTNRELGVEVTYTSNAIIVTVPSPVTVDATDGLIPQEYSLAQNYPNPFNPSTTIQYNLPHESHVLLEVYNLLGQRVAVLMDELREAGYHSVQFDAGNFSSGMYFYRIKAGEFSMVRKLMFIQ